MNKKILIVRLDRIGDVVLSTPVIKAVRDAYPDSHIAFMVQPYAEDVVKGNPYLDEVIVYDKTGNGKGLWRNIRFVRELKGKEFDLAIVLHPTLRTHLILFFAGIPQRIGYDRKGGFLLTKRIPHLKQLGLKHEADYTFDILRYIGIEGIEPAAKGFYMPINPASENKIDNVFAEYKVKKDDIVIAMNPGASCPSKKWPPENFAKVGSVLAEKYGARIAVVSGMKDKDVADEVAGRIKGRVINLAGRTTVGGLASLFRRAKLLVSNDSGPVHIACAVGTPVIAIFGRSDRGLSPLRWGPLGKGSRVLHKDVGCEVCLAHNCVDGFKCLRAVTVDEVLAAATSVLKL